jgi:Flp pilus assembly protein TadD
VNLVDLDRAQGRDDAGVQLLRRELAVVPHDAALHHALGLALARRQRPSEALDALGSAVELRPDAPRYSYVFAVALHAMRQSDRTLEILRRAHERHPADRDIPLALATIHRNRGLIEPALGYARQLVELTPGDPAARALLAELEARRP